jgi:tRNA1Val (adenine37-N6)-methyltransferase
MKFNSNIKIENIGFGDMKLIQNHDYFCYGVDAVILADFAISMVGSFDNAVDLGTGTGVIPFILHHKNPKDDSRIVGVDIQDESVRLADESCEINGLKDSIQFVKEDVKNIAGKASADSCKITLGVNDLVCANPPYFARGTGIASGTTPKFVARHETTADLEDFIIAAGALLKDKGHFCMVHRPSRLVDIFCLCRKHRLEPKHVRFVVPKAGEQPNIVLVHCILGGGKELRFMRELSVYDDKGAYTHEIEQIYERAK